MFNSVLKLAPVFALSGIVALCAACGGSSSKSTGTTGGGGSSTGSSGGSGCSGLSDCCGKLPTADQAGCNEVVKTNVAEECSAELETLQAAGECGGTSSTGSSGGGGCSALSSCCGSLPSSEQPGCNTVVMDANDTACSAALTDFKAAGMCN